jgi:hypothetical protein
LVLLLFFNLQSPWNHLKFIHTVSHIKRSPSSPLFSVWSYYVHVHFSWKWGHPWPVDTFFNFIEKILTSHLIKNAGRSTYQFAASYQAAPSVTFYLLVLLLFFNLQSPWTLVTLNFTVTLNFSIMTMSHTTKWVLDDP